MKRAVAMIFAGLFAVTACASVFADCNGCGGRMQKRHDKMLKRMSKSLDLSAEQKEKIAAVMKETGAKCRETMEAATKDAAAIRQEADKKIRETLTPEQAEKYDALKQNRKEKRESKRKRSHCRD